MTSSRAATRGATFLPVVVAGGDEIVAMAADQIGGDGRDILGQIVPVGGIVGDVDLDSAGDLRGRLGDGADALAGDEQMHFAELRGGGDGGEGRVLHLAALMLDQNQSDAHATTPKVLSLPISSSTEPTLTPAWRFAGSSTFRTVSRGAVSTP